MPEDQPGLRGDIDLANNVSPQKQGYVLFGAFKPISAWRPPEQLLRRLQAEAARSGT